MKRWWWGLVSVLTAIAVSVIVVPQAADWLDVGQQPVAVDYVYILPGHSETRPFIGGYLIQRGLARKALIPTVHLSPDQIAGIQLSHHEIAVRVLRYCGVASEDIETLDISSTSTADESRALARFLAQRPTVRVAIVTSAYHTRRARWILQNDLGDLAERLVFFSAPNPDFRTDRWWRTADGFRTVTSEYLKLVYYWCRYGGGLIWIGGVGVVGLAAAVTVRMRRRRTRIGDLESLAMKDTMVAKV